MRSVAFILIAALALLTACASAPTANRSSSRPGLPRLAQAHIGGHRFTLEIADTDIARTRGLGGRTHLDANGGMLFVFDEPEQQSFVMRDCPFSLSLLYLDDAGRILSIEHMSPEPPRSVAEANDDAAYAARLKAYISPRPVRLVIELPGGTAERLRLSSGDRILFDSAVVHRTTR